MSHDYDPLDLEARNAQVADRKAADEQERKNEINDFVWLMGNKRGRRIVWRLLTSARIYHSSFEAGSTDATAFNEGRRGEGLKLMALINANCPELYVLMLSERTT